MLKLLTPPIFENEHKTHQAFLLHVILWTLIVVLVLYLLYRLILLPHQVERVWVQAVAGEVTTLCLLVLLRRGHVRLACLLLVASLWGFFTFIAMAGRGVQGPSYLGGYALTIVVAGVLLGGRAALAVTLLALLAGGGMVYGEAAGWLSFNYPNNPLTIWVASGVIFPLLAVLQNLAARVLRAALARARASEERLRLITDNMQELVTLLDTQAIIKYASPSCYPVMGYHPAELVGRSGLDFIHPDDAPAVTRLFQQIMQERLARGMVEFRGRHADGHPVWLEATGRWLKDERGEPAGMVVVFRDSTTRRRAELARQESERTLTTLLSNLPGMAYRCENDPDWTMIFVSQGCFELTGYQPEELILSTRVSYNHLIHPADRAMVWQETQAALAANRPFRYIYRLTTAAGQEKWVWEQGRGIAGPEGELGWLEGFIADITLQKQAEQQVHQRNRELDMVNQIITASAEGRPAEVILDIACRELALIFELPYAVAVLLNESLTAVRVVAEYRAGAVPSLLGQVFPLTGQPLGSFLLTTTSPLVSSDIHTDPHLAALEPLLAPELTTVLISPLVDEGRVLGSLTLGAAISRPFTPAEIDLAHHVATQVTLALARARLVQEQRRLSAAVEQTADSVVITDPAGTIVYVNPAYERTSGYNWVETVGQDAASFAARTQNPAVYEEIRATIQAGQSWRGQLTSRKKNGALYTEEMTTTPVRNEQGETTAYVNVLRDVTRELELAAQLRQAQKMEAIGQLAGGIAHDFNNILTVIMGHASMAQMTLSKEHPGYADAEGVLTNARRASMLTRQLLTFARRQVGQPCNLNLNEQIMAITPMLRRLISEQIELTIIPEPALGWTRIDPHQFEQLLMNLVVNARDAMAEGGKLTIRTANLAAGEATVAGPGEYILLMVSDTGSGIAPEHVTRIFEPFFTTKEAGQGTGLGLATCFGIVKQHDGVITVDSEPGQGTAFKVYLPRVEATVETAVAASIVESVPQGQETILLVEDDPAIRRLARRILTGQGYSVVEAANGAEALHLVETWTGAPVPLLLTDVVMPLVGGGDLAEQLRAQWPGLKVLFMSGYTDNLLVQPDRLGPGQAYLAKPFTIVTLAGQVRQLLDS